MIRKVRFEPIAKAIGLLSQFGGIVSFEVYSIIGKPDDTRVINVCSAHLVLGSLQSPSAI
jgi:hypothetical protein